MHFKYDRDSKLMIQMHEARGALVTASATLSNGTAATLLAGDADKMLDLIEVSFATASILGVSVDLMNDGSVIRSVVAPAGGTLHMKFDAPVEQLTKNIAWVVDMEDTTGTTVKVNATFIKREK